MADSCTVNSCNVWQSYFGSCDMNGAFVRFSPASQRITFFLSFRLAARSPPLCGFYYYYVRDDEDRLAGVARPPPRTSYTAGGAAAATRHNSSFSSHIFPHPIVNWKNENHELESEGERAMQRAKRQQQTKGEKRIELQRRFLIFFVDGCL